MPEHTYSGVYIEEIPNGVRTIQGVATSITAFIGRAMRGPVNEPITITNFGDFDSQFVGLHLDYPMSYAVRDFYLNGGTQAIVVRQYTANGAEYRASRVGGDAPCEAQTNLPRNGNTSLSGARHFSSKKAFTGG